MAPSIAPGWRSFGATPTITCLCGLALLGLTSSHTRVAASETRNVDVLVLGAGMAGVRAGDVLARAGVDFLVLEQSHRLGGKCKTTSTCSFCFNHDRPNLRGLAWEQRLVSAATATDLTSEA